MYRHTEDMREISGFGNDYEEVCQNMLEAGVKFLVENGKQDFKVLEISQVYGIVKLEGKDWERLEQAVMAADGAKDCTGAMHHAVMVRLRFINEYGWDAYCEKLRKTREN